MAPPPCPDVHLLPASLVRLLTVESDIDLQTQVTAMSLTFDTDEKKFPPRRQLMPGHWKNYRLVSSWRYVLDHLYVEFWLKCKKKRDIAVQTDSGEDIQHDLDDYLISLLAVLRNKVKKI